MINKFKMFSGVDLIIVESGCVIACPSTREDFIVSDENSAYISSRIYLTQKNFDAIKNSTEIKDLVKQDVNLEAGIGE